MTLRYLLILLLMYAPLLVASGEDTPATSAQKAELAAEAKAFITKCVMAAGSADEMKLDLHPESILRWSNPTAGEVHGEVFVWTDRGRPSVVASYYHFFTPDWGSSFEVASCSDTAASATVDGVTFWRSSQPGMTSRVMEGVDPPAKTPAARLIQMRRIAGDFSADLSDTRTATGSVKRHLRLLNQPVFRFPAPMGKSSYVDGSLFVFVEGTDPEVVLFLEAVEAGGAPVWKYGVTRMNRDDLQIKYRDTVVSTFPYIEQVLGRPREPYTVFALRERLQNVSRKSADAKSLEVRP